MTFREAFEWLSRFQFHGIRPGLERITTLLSRLGHPEKAFKAIHIAGTNGKGSTAAILESLLRHHGIKTGLYTSPHLVSVCERFMVAGRSISEERFAALCTRVRKALGELPATYFELTTALAFLYFAEEGVELAIVECGLGGRLDATNVINPEVTVITNIGLDHQVYLGETIPQVAAEKAGIIKKGCPVVVGPVNPEAFEVIANRAQSLSAPLFQFDEDFRVIPSQGGFIYQGKYRLSGLKLSLRGRFQTINLALALKTFELLREQGFPFHEETVRQGLRHVVWPGRYETFKLPRLVILDGAHNLDGIRALLESLHEDGIKRYHLLFAVSDEGGTKPYFEMLRALLPEAERVFLCEPPGPRKPVTIKEWQEYLERAKKGGNLFRDISFVFKNSWEEALEEALKGSSLPLLITGSLYLVGQVRARLRPQNNSC